MLILWKSIGEITTLLPLSLNSHPQLIILLIPQKLIIGYNNGLIGPIIKGLQHCIMPHLKEKYKLLNILIR
jgi:hypothetical protein